jgi:hypothetical protein
MSPRSIVINRGPSLYSMYYIEKSAELGERSCMTEFILNVVRGTYLRICKMTGGLVREEIITWRTA